MHELARLLTVPFYLKMIASDRDFAYTYSASVLPGTAASGQRQATASRGLPINSAISRTGLQMQNPCNEKRMSGNKRKPVLRRLKHDYVQNY